MSRHDLPPEVDLVADLFINPLTDIITRLIVVLADKKVVSKEQGLAIVAQAVNVTNDLQYPQPIIEQSQEMLMRMIKAIDAAVEPNRPLT